MKKEMKRILSAAAAFLVTVAAAAGSGYIDAEEPQSYLVGGMPFGVKFLSEGIVIVGFSEVETEMGNRIPAYDAGLRINDIITKVNNIDVKTTAELMDMMEESEDSVKITYLRNGDENTVTFSPIVCKVDGKRKTGMWIRDTTAGIGTVTYIDPQTGSFGGLGHGICDPESGELLKMNRGTVVDVQITGIQKGISGTPGELKGYFASEKSGVLLENTPCGVYGVLSDIPESIQNNEPYPIASRYDVTEGEAVIRCTLDENAVREYSVRIEDIHYSSHDNRSFSVIVTDPDLLEKTGGIIQGMSGSPIIQDGKLIGAVTHVLVNDPAKGYGIFIENMLEAAG